MVSNRIWKTLMGALMLLVLVVGSSPTFAETNAEVQRQIDDLLPKAKNGDRDAEFHLARAYQELARSYPDQQSVAFSREGREWMEKAAKAGHAEAQCRFGMGMMSSSEIEAIEWVKKSADQGYVRAQAELGNIISTENGRGQLSTIGYTEDRSSYEPKLSPAYEYYNTLVAGGKWDQEFDLTIKIKKKKL
jgi:TPR repeat protein